MKTNQLKIHSQEYMETMARLMSEALESPEGMQALAAAIAAPIEQEIKRKEISSLLLTKHTLPKGERPVYQKKPTVKAHWISKDGDAQEQEVGKDEVEFPTNRIHSNPMVDVSVLKNGNIGTLMDIQTSAADAIRKVVEQANSLGNPIFRPEVGVHTSLPRTASGRVTFSDEDRLPSCFAVSALAAASIAAACLSVSELVGAATARSGRVSKA